MASRPALSKYAWQKKRARALQRDGNRCRRCVLIVRNFRFNHIIRPEDGGSDDLSNLITLCDRCHRLEHKANRRQRFPGRRGVRQPTSIPPTQPGLEYPSPISGKNRSRPEDGNYEDDPEAGIFWGPKQPNGMMTRWSRPWFDWRSEEANARHGPV